MNRNEPPGDDAADDGAPNDGEDAAAFRAAMRDVRPLRQTARAPRPPRPRPLPRFSSADEAAALAESLADDSPTGLQPGDELRHLRAGANPRLLRRLRRGEFAVAAELDLHGLNERRAADAIREFLAMAVREQWRCVRIIHGKGLRSGPAGPVLKHLTVELLRQRDDVLAFASARPADGGTGAVVVLLDKK